MRKIGFDNDQYVRLQSERIRQRINKFGGKLYLEFGGKLFDDFHASRVLPGFRPDSKIRMLMEMKAESEVIVAISADDIERNKRRGDMRLFRGALELPKAEIPVSEITGVSLMGPQDLYISAGDTHYVIRSSTVHCMVKYLTALSHLNGDVHYGE